MKNMSEIFSFSDYADKKILVGAYRSDKDQLAWILGDRPKRKQKLYNVRFNADLFANRRGGVTKNNLPDVVLLYDDECLHKPSRLFVCIGAKKVDEKTMSAMQYPDPQGSYLVYVLGNEIAIGNFDCQNFIETYRASHSEFVPGQPIFTTGEQLAEFQKITEMPQSIAGNETVYRSIDLFAGIGGIRRGFENAFGKQCETVFVSEWDKPATQTYKANYPFDPFEIAGDITAINEANIPAFDICLAGFPCQAFSMAGKRMGFNDDYKGRCRGTLFLDVARICEYHKPKVIFCENVKGLINHDKGNTFRIICETFENLGYKVFHKVLNSKDFGIPQQRERIYLVCFRNDIAPETFDFPEGTKQKVCIADIMDPAPIPAKYYLSETYVETLKRHRARHEAAGHGFGYVIRPLDGIAGTIVCGGMGKETNLIIDTREHSLIPTTHIKGEINKEGIRKMTPREWARLQGYPDSFILPLSDVHLYKQLGNSVSVPVIQAIATEIKKILNNNN